MDRRDVVRVWVGMEGLLVVVLLLLVVVVVVMVSGSHHLGLVGLCRMMSMVVMVRNSRGRRRCWRTPHKGTRRRRAIVVAAATVRSWITAVVRGWRRWRRRRRGVIDGAVRMLLVRRRVEGRRRGTSPTPGRRRRGRVVGRSSLVLFVVHVLVEPAG